MNTAAMVLVMLAVVAIMVVVMTLMMRAKYVRETRGHTLCFVVTDTGKCHLMLLKDVPGGVRAPKKAPVEGGVYFIGPGQVFNVLYPLHGTPNWMRVRCGAAFIAAGNAEAWAPFSAPPVTTEVKAELAYERGVSAAVLGTAQRELDRLSGAKGGMKPLYTYILIGIAVIAALMIGYFSYMAYAQSAYLMQAFGM